MSYTLVEFYKDQATNSYNVVIPEGYDEERMGMMYFVYYCNNINFFAMDDDNYGPFYEEEKLLHNLINSEDWKLILHLLKNLKITDKLKKISWMKWYIDRCDCEYIEDYDNIWDKLEEYGDDIVSSYTWKQYTYCHQVYAVLVKN